MTFDTGVLFDNFVAASTLKTIQQSFNQLCIALEIDPSDAPNVYKNLRRLNDWKAEKLWKLLDKRVEQSEYRKQTAADKLNVLVIGAGPCGLRSAIECALLGCRVVLVEERDKFSRNNVLHLWEFVIHDIKALGAKIFYPKFCTGSIEHISIRQLQCILLKVALCLGVQVHEGVSFRELIFPENKENGEVSGFRAGLEPRGHILSEFEIDVLIGADGKRSTVPGFRRKEMRGKLAIAITANFVNNRTQAEERVPEISGVAYIFNQQFFKEMQATTGVDLENIVYYKDDTHYFVMCAKKQSLFDMGVLKQDFEDVSKLLDNDNLNFDALCNYARAAANFATHGKLPSLDYAKNHRGKEDIAAFDFTSLYSSHCSVRLVERKNKRLLMGIVGDSLHEPFWPTGSGCARGFLGVFDTAWLIREYGLNQRGPLQMIADRESTYRLLAQVTKDNMHKVLGKYTIDPRTRYVSLENTLEPDQVAELINSDNPRTLPVSAPLPLNRSTSVHDVSTRHMLRYALWRFCSQALAPYKLRLIDLDSCWRDGRALGGLVAKFRPESLDYFSVVAVEDISERLQRVFCAIEKSLSVPAPCEVEEWPSMDENGKLAYIGRIVAAIRADPVRLCEAIVTPRSAAPKRRIAPSKMTVSRRKTQPIEKLAQDLLGCSSFSVEKPERPPVKKLDIRDLNERHQERLERLSASDATQPPRVAVVGAKSAEKADAKVVERQPSPKLDRDHLRQMEQKLLATGLGLVSNKSENMTSRDEQIMRVSAASARKEAESGFRRDSETDRFKPYDETIQKSEEALKRRELIGLDPFEKWRMPPTATVTPSTSTTDTVTRAGDTVTSVTDTVPSQRAGLGFCENGENGPIFAKPTAPVAPKRHSVPVVESCYDSVNPRRQTNCQLCNKVVYLAERMQVEGMFIHKHCFRCAYCSQPLRLGDYGKDKDLDYHYPKKFFCKIHLGVPLREKIARIERAARKMERAASRDSADVPPLLPATAPPKEKSPRDRERRATLSFFSSPELLREKTTEKLSIDTGARAMISPVSELSSVDCRTPERAEFGSHIRKTSVASTHDKKADLHECISLSESEEEEEIVVGEERAETNRRSEAGLEDADTQRTRDSENEEGEDDESLSENGLEEEDLAELETSVLQMVDENPKGTVTDEQLKSVIEKINQRRVQTIASPLRMNTPARKDSTDDEFFTPSVAFRPETGQETPSRVRARTIAAMPTEEDFNEYRTPSIVDIRKQKTAELDRLRSESKARAKQKSDAELGIGSARNSVPVFAVPTTPLSARSQTVSPPRDRPRASSLLSDMPSLRRDNVHPMPAVPQSPPPPVPGQGRDAEGDEDLFVTPRTERKPVQHSAGMGMLSKLFSPDQIRKKSPSSVENGLSPDRLHCESRKETNILGNAFRRLKLRRGEKDASHSIGRNSPVADISVATSSASDSHQPPVAAVPPSPRVREGVIEQETSSIASPIAVSHTTLKQFHRKAEKIIRRRDESLAQNAQELERTIQNNEIRLEEIKKEGSRYEEQLIKDPVNKWKLECWLALVRENEMLSSVYQDNQLRLQKMQLQVRYRELNARFVGVQQSDPDEMVDSQLLADMLSVVKEKDRVEKALADMGRFKFKRSMDPEALMREKGNDFRNFAPVFSS